MRTLNPDPNKILPLAPDFVIELRSATDRLVKLQQKMQVYRDNGLRLGWLINPQECQVEIYRSARLAVCDSNRTIETVASPMSLAGEDVLPGFRLDLTTVW